MPKALEPNVKYPICLESDADIPPVSRPVFWVESLSIRKQNELTEIVDGWAKAARERDNFTVREYYEMALPFFMKYVHGWANMNNPTSGDPLEFNESNIRDWLSYQEVRELIGTMLKNGHLSDVEKKKIRIGALLWTGRLCKQCSGKCVELEEGGWLEVKCPNCVDGCEMCVYGKIILKDCPNKEIDDFIPVIEAIQDCENGMPPISGGSLDQGAFFMAARRRWKSEIALAKSDQRNK